MFVVQPRFHSTAVFIGFLRVSRSRGLLIGRRVAILEDRNRLLLGALVGYGLPFYNEYRSLISSRCPAASGQERLLPTVLTTINETGIM